MPFSADHFSKLPIVGIIRGLAEEGVEQLLSIYVEEGFTTLEITMNTANAPEMIKKALNNFGNQLNVGAGTVRTAQELEAALAAGAQFIVTPIVEAAVIEQCLEQSIPVFPGAYTPTEIYHAWRMGATAVKVFPASIGGIEHVKAVKAPLEMVPLLPTGGVNANNLGQFFDLGIYGVGMGSQLFPKALIANKDWEGVRTQLVRVKKAYESWKEGTD